MNKITNRTVGKREGEEEGGGCERRGGEGVETECCNGYIVPGRGATSPKPLNHCHTWGGGLGSTHAGEP